MDSGEFDAELDEVLAETSRYTGPRLWAATDLVGAQQPEWLARNRIPRSAVTILVGDEGIGKSLFWVWIAAAVTTGRALPEFGVPARDPGRVLLVATEDEWSHTVRPRLEVAGADLAKISVICTEEDGSGSPVFPRDMALVHEAGAALVIVDAFVDTVAGNLAMKDPQQARLALHPWKEAATATGSAILLLTHTNRTDSKSARDRYGITSELRKKARMTLFAQQDEDGRLVIGPEKSNITTKLPASTFAIDAVQKFAPTVDDDGTIPRLVYAGESEHTAGQLLAANYDARHGDDAEDRSEAEGWLEDFLTESPGAESKLVKAEARKAIGVSDRTLKRAAKSLRVAITSTGFPRRTTWTLPDHSGASQVAEVTYLSERGPTGPTGSDKGKRGELTGPIPQSGHAEKGGPTGDATVASAEDPTLFDDANLCGECGNRLDRRSLVARCAHKHPGHRGEDAA